MWRTRLSRTWDWLQSRKLVGEDKHHLFYTEFIAKGQSERRYVEYKDKNLTHSSDRMPIEWWSWLHNRRDEIPTGLELEQSAIARQRLAERVAVLEAEDERERLRHLAGGSDAGAGSGEGIADSVRASAAGSDEVAARRRRKALMRLHGAASSHDSMAGQGRVDSEGRPVQGDSAGGEDFQPEFWTPSSSKRRTG